MAMPYSSHNPTPNPENRDIYVMALKDGHELPAGWREDLMRIKGLTITASGAISFRVSAPPGVIGPLVSKFSEDFHIELLEPHRPQDSQPFRDLCVPQEMRTGSSE